MEAAKLVIAVGFIIFLSHYFTSIFEKKGIPDVLLLMLVGILIGPVLKLVTPESFGILTNMFTTITLVFILFQGGLDLRMETLGSAFKGTTALTLGGFGVTTVITGLLFWLLIGFHPLSAFTLGAIVGGTSSAVVIPLVKQIKMEQESRTILVLESALTDVLCIVFVLAFSQASSSQGLMGMKILGNILSSFTLATVIGIASALLWSALLNSIRTLNNSMFTTPAYLFVVYGIAELLGFSGAIAALAFGISIANIDRFPVRYIRRIRKEGFQTFNETEKQFFSEVVFLLKTFFFVFIGISIEFTNVWAILLGVVLTMVIYIARIPTVKFFVREPLPVFDRSVMATMGPKGLAAAVLAGIPAQTGMPHGEMIRLIVFAVILTSIVFTSILIPLLEKVPAVANFYAALLGPTRSQKPSKGTSEKGNAEIQSSTLDSPTEPDTQVSDEQV